MDIRWDQCLALSFATVALAPGASAKTATASVRAEVVTPSEVGAAAAQSLVSNSPGVFALRIPGAAPAPAITVIAQSSASGGGTIDFVASGESAGALQTAIAQISASAPTASGGATQLVTAPADGTMSSHGVQIALSGSAPGAEGGDVMIAVLAFD